MKTTSMFALIAAIASSSNAIALDTDMVTTAARATGSLSPPSLNPLPTLSVERRDDSNCIADSTICIKDRGPVVNRIMEAISVDVDENHKEDLDWTQSYTGNQTVACVKGDRSSHDAANYVPMFCARLLDATEDYTLYEIFDMLFRMVYMDRCDVCGSVPDPTMSADAVMPLLQVDHIDDTSRKGCEGLCGPAEM